MDYEITIGDSKLFTRPLTVAGLVSRAAKGVEGSLALQNIFGEPQ